MRSPMDIEMDLRWKRGKKTSKGVKPFPYSTPIKKRRVDTKEDIDCTSIIQYVNEIPPSLPPSSSNNEKGLSKLVRVLPYVCISYLHLILNIVVIFILIYGVVSLAIFLRNDVRAKISDRKTFLKNLIEVSRMNYNLNKCDPRTRVPAMNNKCTEWEVIMNKRLSSIEMTKIVVEVFGEACDGFINKISVKSCVVCGVFFIIFLLFRNSRIGSR